ncbi:hypothetical protein [Candidatus Ruminimicrobium bovinum]|uniref:hypothetical protein n=1 Tax=Candidatus Ruminimicrobium bovinum TaxID=3242779 RepID=UPI0039B89402
MKIQGMSGNIYSFAGPHFDTDSIENKSGVYAIIDSFNGKYYLLDIGESHDVKNRLASHDRRDCWKRNKKGTILYYVYYTLNKQQAGRMDIEQDIRKNKAYHIPCGER